MFKSFRAAVLFLFWGSLFTNAQDTVSILFIGNSYTFANTGVSSPELPMRLKEMGRLYGKVIQTDFSGAGGITLERNWNAGKAVMKIKNGSYDYVVIQEHSLGTIYNMPRFESYVQKFSELVREHNAIPVLYMTWGRQNRPAMIDTISQEYIKMAVELNAKIAPCGYAWDMANTQFPGIPLYWSDHSHPRPEGVMLNTFVFYNTLFGDIPKEPLYNFNFRNMSIPEDTVRILMEVAYRANREINFQLGDQ